MLNNIGAELYATWSDDQKRVEIERLVTAYNNGLPVSVLCMTTEAIAGSRSEGRRHLVAIMGLAERLDAISSAQKETKEIRRLVRAMLN